MKCLVKSCHNYTNKKIDGISYHRLPKLPELKQRWLKMLNLDEGKSVHALAVVCSVHFDENCFRTDKSRRLLKTTAIPTLMLNHSDCDRLQISSSNSSLLGSTIHNLAQLMKELKKKKLITSCQMDKFLDICDPNLSLINTDEAQKYPDDFKKFALNLNFHCPKAYDYVRNQFSNFVPPYGTLSNWYKMANGLPGFTEESFHALELMVRSKKEHGESVVGNVCLGEMFIYPKYEYDFTTKKAWGFVVFDDNEEADNNLASRIIVFMFVCCNGCWKIPIGYFPVEILTCVQKKNLIEICLRLLYNVGVITIGVTLDGLFTNFAVARELGCDTSIQNMHLAFHLPDISHQFLISFDPGHMFKLVRDVLATNGPFIDTDGKIISWSYLDELYNIHLSNTIKVPLAVQTLSNSVANVLEFCNYTLKLPKFEGCDGTINFIRIFNNLFDILNSKKYQNPNSGYKKPIDSSNFQFIQNYISISVEYISNLKFLSDGTKVINSKDNCGFIGIISCLNNIQTLHHNYLLTNTLKYISYHKLSQDHVEHYFSIIRSMLDSSYPTLRQFATAYKRNCTPQVEISILNLYNVNSHRLINSSVNRLAMVQVKDDFENQDTDLQNMYNEGDFLGYPIILSEFSINVIEYIGRVIVRFLFKKLNCEDCCNLIRQTNFPNFLLKVKNNRGFNTPSPSVLKICKYSEAILKQEAIIADYEIQSNLIFFKKICFHVHHNLLNENIFPENYEYQYSHSQEHLHLLVQCIIEKYYDIRLNYICNESARKLTNRNKIMLGERRW